VYDNSRYAVGKLGDIASLFNALVSASDYNDILALVKFSVAGCTIADTAAL